ncbi:MAG: BA14K family protein [Aquamicrobium sp.]|nr:BA14K family protein [Aquamicrobium sp.]
MTSLLKKSAAAGLIAATALTAALPAAQAGERWRHRDRGGDMLAAGVLGLATGALIAGAARPAPIYRERYYDDGYYAPPPVVYERPVRVYEQPRRVYVERYATYEPWTDEWYRYCSDRYRSFDPSSGTFVGYDGVRRFCEVN